MSNIYKCFCTTNKMKYVLIGGVIILAVFFIVLSKIPIGIEPLTELYFNNHTNLPTEIKQNQTYNFSFTINNLEYKNMTYNYVITAEYDNKTMNITNKYVTLVNNQSISIPETYMITENFTRAKILVTIKNTQTIDFWVTKKN